MRESATIEENLSLPEEQAFQLSRCAMAIDRSRDDMGKLTTALNDNLQLWVAIRTMAEHEECSLSPEVRKNLTTLGEFVADKVFASSEGISEETVSTLININLQISEGLLEGAAQA